MTVELLAGWPRGLEGGSSHVHQLRWPAQRDLPSLTLSRKGRATSVQPGLCHLTRTMGLVSSFLSLSSVSCNRGREGP